MGNILFKIYNSYNSYFLSRSLLFVNLEEKKIFNYCNYPYILARIYGWKYNLQFLYKDNDIYKLSLNNDIDISPVILNISDEFDNDLSDNFIDYLNVPIWIILYNEKINCKKLKIDYINDSIIEKKEFIIKNIKYNFISDIL